MDDKDKALLKKDLYIAVISNGSAAQKERVVETAEKAFEWCTSHIGQAKAPTLGRKKKADK